MVDANLLHIQRVVRSERKQKFEWILLLDDVYTQYYEQNKDGRALHIALHKITMVQQEYLNTHNWQSVFNTIMIAFLALCFVYCSKSYEQTYK